MLASTRALLHLAISLAAARWPLPACAGAAGAGSAAGRAASTAASTPRAARITADRPDPRLHRPRAARTQPERHHAAQGRAHLHGRASRPSAKSANAQAQLQAARAARGTAARARAAGALPERRRPRPRARRGAGADRRGDPGRAASAWANSAEDRKRIDDELEFYKRDPTKAPDSLRRKIEDNARSVAVQNRFIGEQEDEKKRVNARFDEEQARLKPLWALAARLPRQPPPAATGDRRAGPRCCSRAAAFSPASPSAAR